MGIQIILTRSPYCLVMLSLECNSVRLPHPRLYSLSPHRETKYLHVHNITVATTAQKSNLTGKAVMNMSLGGGKSAAVNAAINQIRAAGVLPIVAAGNDNVDGKLIIPQPLQCHPPSLQDNSSGQKKESSRVFQDS